MLKRNSRLSVLLKALITICRRAEIQLDESRIMQTHPVVKVKTGNCVYSLSLCT